MFVKGLKKFLRCLVLSLWFLPLTVFSETISFTAGDIVGAINRTDDAHNGVNELVGERLAAELEVLGISLDKGALLSQQDFSDIELTTGCTRASELKTLSLSTAISDSTGLSLDLVSFQESIDIDVHLELDVVGDGKVNQRFGARLFGDCSYYGTDSFTFSVNAEIGLDITVSLLLNPVVLDSNSIRLTPQITVTGGLESYSHEVNVDHTLVDGTIEDELSDELDVLLSNEQVTEYLTKLETDLQQALLEQWEGGYVDLDIAGLSGEELGAAYTGFDSFLDFPLTRLYLNEHRAEIILAALTGDTSALQEDAVTAAACDAVDTLQLDMPHHSLYSINNGGECVAVDLRGAEQQAYFNDENCSETVAFKPTSVAEYCASTLDKQRFGNAEDVAGMVPVWALNPGTRLDVSLESTAENHQPFMTRQMYREVEGEKGICQLEMRIYKSSLAAEGLKPLLAFHGGSWRHRVAGYTVLESTLSHFTDDGFIVFAPFYRLVDGVDGNSACNDVSVNEVLSDTSEALQWVKSNGAKFGAAQDAGISVTGQSAGAYLAAWLAVNRSSDVDNALLLYPPTDFVDYLNQVQADENGLIDSGAKAVEGLLGKSLDELSTTDANVIEHSLPQKVENRIGDIPPMFILHGMSDVVVPPSQSQRLCNALGGSADNGSAKLDGGSPEDGTYRKIYECDASGSQLHFIAEADHAFDLCPLGVNCIAGGVESQAMTKDSLKSGREWLYGQGKVLSQGGNSSTGGGSLAWLLLLGLSRLIRRNLH